MHDLNLDPETIARLERAGRIAIVPADIPGDPWSLCLVENGTATETILVGKVSDVRLAAARLAVQIDGLKLVDMSSETVSNKAGAHGHRRKGLQATKGLTTRKPLQRKTPLKPRKKQ